MDEDFIAELGQLALAARLKRLSDQMIHNGRNLYRYKGMDIEPNWYLVFKLLNRHGKLSVTDISKCLRMSHPSIIAMINKMKEKGYLQTKKDEQDSRRQTIQLTTGANDLLPTFEKVWNANERAIGKLLEPNPDFLSQLENLEKQLVEKDLMTRTLDEIGNK